MFILGGYVFDPRARYSFTVWTSAGAASIIVAGNIPGVTQTIPLAIYEYASSPSSETMALSLCLVSVVISLVVLFGHEMMAKRMARRG